MIFAGGFFIVTRGEQVRIFSKWLILTVLILGFAVSASASSPLLPNQIPLSQEAKTELLYRAEAGDADAQYKLGELYHNWAGTPSDYNEALKWFKMAEKKRSFASDKIKSLESEITYRQALYEKAKAGTPEDYYQFGINALHRPAKLPGDKEAFDWIFRAARAGHVEARHTLGNLYWQAFHMRQIQLHHVSQYNQNFDWYYSYHGALSKWAVANSTSWFQGENLEDDVRQAIHWLSLAASNEPKAMYELGLIYIMKGPTHNMTRARYWINRSIESGYQYFGSICQMEFTGHLFEYPLGMGDDKALIVYEGAPNYSSAFNCISKIGTSYPARDWQLGYMYSRGLGVKRDIGLAITHLETSAKGHDYDVEAMAELSKIYERKRDFKKAYILISEAADIAEYGRVCEVYRLSFYRALRKQQRNVALSKMKHKQAELYKRLNNFQKSEADKTLVEKDIAPFWQTKTMKMPLPPCAPYIW